MLSPLRSTFSTSLPFALFGLGWGFLALCATADDHSDDPAAATDVTPLFDGPPLVGVLEQSWDDDWFKFTVSTTTSYLIESTATNLSLFSPPAFGIGDYIDRGHSGWSRIMETLSPGVYYIQSAGYETGTYELTLETYADDYGSSIETTTDVTALIDSGDLIQGTLEEGQDRDMTSFTLTSHQALHFDFFGSLTQVKCEIKKRGDIHNTAVGVSVSNLSVIEGLEPGTYDVTILGAFPDTTGPYHLTISTFPDDYPNRSVVATDVTSFAAGTLIDGNLEYEEDVDWLKVTLSNPGDLVVAVGGPTEVVGRLYNSESDQLGVFYGTPNPGFETAVLPAGDYFLRIAGESRWDAGSYTLAITSTGIQSIVNPVTEPDPVWWPSVGWLYMQWPYLYDPSDETWRYYSLGSSNESWHNNLNTGQWSELDSTVGWLYFGSSPGYFYELNDSSWHYYSTNNLQWINALNENVWAVFRYSP